MTERSEQVVNNELGIASSIAYLKPDGNFTHIAATQLKQNGYENSRLIGLSSIDAMFDSISSGRSRYALVPLENSTDGAVPDTHKNLWQRDGLQIVGEFVLPISLSLYYQNLNEVRIVASKDSAIGQTKQSREEKFGPDFPTMTVDSTGEAVALAAKDPTIAAIGSSISADVQGLSGILEKEDGFNDKDSNATTFALVQKAWELPAQTGNDKTTFIMTISDSRGSLVSALDVLAEEGLDLNKLKSIGRANGSVSFLVSSDGHLNDGVTQEALMTLEKSGVEVKRFGSYPKSDFMPEENEDTYDFEAAIDRIHEEAANGEEMDINKTIAVFTLKDHPGALRDALMPFAKRGVNLSKIDSQPSGIHDEHILYLAFDKATEGQEELLEEFGQQCHFVKIIPGGGRAK